MKSFQLKYGAKNIVLNLDESRVLSVISGKKLLPLSDPEDRVKTVLKYPISSRSIHDEFKPGEKVAIVASDRTRNTAASTFLPTIVKELNSIGIKDGDITIYFACGAHRLHTREEHVNIVGEDLAERIKLVDHDCSDKDNLVDIGTTSRGTKVIVNKEIYNSDRIILTGAITYHYFAGYGGGRKAILPGISAFESIQANHKLCFGSDMARTGVLTGNPVHEDMLEAARMVGPDMIINVILDDIGRLVSVFAGELNEAHVAGCEALDNNCKVVIEKKADLVIASAGGGTKDVDFVQSHKAMEMASYALNDGGTMILLAEASEGFPSTEYLKYAEMGSAAAVEESLKKNFTIPGHTVMSALKKSEKFKIIWVTKIDGESIKKFGITPAKNLAEAMNLAGSAGPAYIMPQAYNTFPVLK